MGGRFSRAVDERVAADALERFRRTGIRLDREGRFWHEGQPIAHAGLRRALLRWIDRLDDGRPVLRLDANRWAYVDVEDALLLVTSARWDGDRLLVRTNDGAEEELAYDTLRLGAAGALYCDARNRRLPARITTPAYYVLTERVEETDAGFALRAAGRTWPLA
jgi:hypothetical protein